MVREAEYSGSPGVHFTRYIFNIYGPLPGGSPQGFTISLWNHTYDTVCAYTVTSLALRARLACAVKATLKSCFFTSPWSVETYRTIQIRIHIVHGGDLNFDLCGIEVCRVLKVSKRYSMRTPIPSCRPRFKQLYCFTVFPQTISSSKWSLQYRNKEIIVHPGTKQFFSRGSMFSEL